MSATSTGSWRPSPKPGACKGVEPADGPETPSPRHLRAVARDSPARLRLSGSGDGIDAALGRGGVLRHAGHGDPGVLAQARLADAAAARTQRAAPRGR